MRTGTTPWWGVGDGGAIVDTLLHHGLTGSHTSLWGVFFFSYIFQFPPPPPPSDYQLAIGKVPQNLLQDIQIVSAPPVGPQIVDGQTIAPNEHPEFVSNSAFCFFVWLFHIGTQKAVCLEL